MCKRCAGLKVFRPFTFWIFFSKPVLCLPLLPQRTHRPALPWLFLSLSGTILLLHDENGMDKKICLDQVLLSEIPAFLFPTYLRFQQFSNWSLLSSNKFTTHLIQDPYLIDNLLIYHLTLPDPEYLYQPSP